MNMRRYRGFLVPRLFNEASAHSDEAAERFYQGAVSAIRRILGLMRIEVTVVGADNIPATGGALLAGNHTGYMDFALMGTGPHVRGNRLVRFMAKKSVFEVPLLGRILRKMHHVPVDRAKGAASISSAVENLRNGNLVGIFPEATISRSFELAHFKTGAVRIAREADVPLIPTVIWGSQRIWTKDLPKQLRGVPVIIRYGEPVPLTGDAEADTAELKCRMQQLLDLSQAEYSERYGPFGAEPWLPKSMGGTAPTIEEAEELYRAEKERRQK